MRAPRSAAPARPPRTRVGLNPFGIPGCEITAVHRATLVVTRCSRSWLPSHEPRMASTRSAYAARRVQRRRLGAPLPGPRGLCPRGIFQGRHMSDQGCMEFWTVIPNRSVTRRSAAIAIRAGGA